MTGSESSSSSAEESASPVSALPCSERDFFDPAISITVTSEPEKKRSLRRGSRSSVGKLGFPGGVRSTPSHTGDAEPSKLRGRGKLVMPGHHGGSTSPLGPTAVTHIPCDDEKQTTASRLRRYRVMSDIPKEEVLAKSGVQPSAAFPAGLDNIGPHSFRKLKVLGRGGAGTVYLVNLRGTDMVYAMKELTKEDMIRRKKVTRVMTEREILASANHPFIVTMYATFQTHTRLCFVMDYCAGGEFFGVLSSQPKKRLREDAARFYAAEVLLALEYLHYLGFFYRDLKPENILMRASGHIALTDFDLSKQAQAVCPRMIEHHRTMVERLSTLVSANRQTSKLCEFDIVDSEPVLETESTSFVGTLEYLAPEVVKGERQNSAVDWWTFGVLIYEIMTGMTPFRAETSEEILDNITGGHRVHWESDVGSPEARRLVKRLLRRDPKKRLGAENGASDIKKSSWFSQVNFSLIRNEQPPIIPHAVNLADFDGVDLDKEDSDGTESDDSQNDESKVFANFDMKRDDCDLKQY